MCDLTEPLGLSQPTISHHLKAMAHVGLAARDKRGVWAYYRIVVGALTGLAAAGDPAGLVSVAPVGG